MLLKFTLLHLPLPSGAMGFSGWLTILVFYAHFEICQALIDKPLKSLGFFGELKMDKTEVLGDVEGVGAIERSAGGERGFHEWSDSIRDDLFAGFAGIIVVMVGVKLGGVDYDVADETAHGNLSF